MLLDFLVLLAILCILFGVEATRAFIFGAFGFIFWIILALVIIFILVPSPMQKFKREQRKEAARVAAKNKKEAPKQKTSPVALAGLCIIGAMAIIGLILALALAK